MNRVSKSDKSNMENNMENDMEEKLLEAIGYIVECFLASSFKPDASV